MAGGGEAVVGQVTHAGERFGQRGGSGGDHPINYATATVRGITPGGNSLVANTQCHGGGRYIKCFTTARSVGYPRR
ncbi:hypothetical protein Phou_009160 [Phytohabitans houttuyneae]|uniref:Uncharacterized protein n=1 Tax=Phytohabitans houttuyneae TaxID=1076126 RepID=A0A6V8K442_9ACTN|nr:hypothetical protein Phou_009160 [Phytohabitans houttuyneae]